MPVVTHGHQHDKRRPQTTASDDDESNIKRKLDAWAFDGGRLDDRSVVFYCYSLYLLLFLGFCITPGICCYSLYLLLLFLVFVVIPGIYCYSWYLLLFLVFVVIYSLYLLLFLVFVVIRSIFCYSEYVLLFVDDCIQLMRTSSEHLTRSIPRSIPRSIQEVHRKYICCYFCIFCFS